MVVQVGGVSRLRARRRPRELGLLVVVALALLTGWLSLATQQAGSLTAGQPGLIVGYLLLLLAAHLALVLAGRASDQVLLPTVGLLGGISLLFMVRLPQGLAHQTLGPFELGLAQLQLAWLTLSLAILVAVAVAVRSDTWLRYYKYTWAAGGVALLLLVFAFGEDTNGARLFLRVGPLAGQPSELLKIILVVFLAGYLADNRALLARASTHLGPLRLPPLPYLLPMAAMWGIALAIVIFQRDLGAALLFFSVFLALLYVATQRTSYVVLGAAVFLAGSAVLYRLVPTVQTRVDIWLDPWSTAQTAGYQIVRALYAFGRGGILGTGLGAGLPAVAGVPAIPAIQTDFVFAGLAEELGLMGALAILLLYLIVAQRGLRIAAAARDEFRSLLVAGLTFSLTIQAAIIMAGDAKLIPLTGITLPFVSYGGSSLVANGIIVGLLVAFSDPGPLVPAVPAGGSRRERAAARARAAAGRIERAVS
ncbi:MAG TPA: FtsW/RodA/SpoVE family cell cycle protein [Candidatus Limnocylindrales bacterium]|nr:FtsW/RodA/SpoVE family cell cycle protein [Candidatus Limnocylindrales bacterium]